MLSNSIAKLVQYGIETGLTPECERIYTTNLLLDCFKEDEYTGVSEIYENVDLESTLTELLNEAVPVELLKTVSYIVIFSIQKLWTA